MKVEKSVLLDYIDRGFTINMIIEDMGITKSSLYYHISKYDILDKFKKNLSVRDIEIELIDKNGNVTTLPSMTKVAEFLGVAKGTITYNLKRKRALKGYVLNIPGSNDDFEKMEKAFLAEKERKLRKIKKEEKLNFWNEELEMAFRKLGYKIIS